MGGRTALLPLPCSFTGSLSLLVTVTGSHSHLMQLCSGSDVEVLYGRHSVLAMAMLTPPESGDAGEAEEAW